ncbi:cytochrome P450 [Aspergillus undulatus]|uniref:cytochrome P450 n=1 Tax=Aspergillus undulatus TaxID=1810928 RepID=UPI003CCC8F25
MLPASDFTGAGASWGSVSSSLTLYLPVICLALYLLYFLYIHPLAKYPGPVLSKVTSARAAYHAWNGDLHLDMWLCHRKYGSPIVRYGPNHLIFEDPAVLKDIYAAGQNVSKPSMYSGPGNGKANLLTLADKKEHSRRRRLIGRGFTESSLRAFTPRLVHHIQRFCAIIDRESRYGTASQSRWSPPLDMSDWCSYLTFDIMCDFVFGVSYNLLESEELRRITVDIEDAKMRAAILVWAPYLFIGRLDKMLFKGSVRARNRYLVFLNRLLADSSARETREYDIFAYLNSSKYTEDGALDHRQILSETSLLVVAGYDTTATALCALLFYLSRNPHAYNRLTHEIRSVFPPSSQITSPRKLEESPSLSSYLTACIDESLRMSPPIASCLFREVGAGGITVDNEFIEPGMLIGTGVYSLHHNPRNYERPDEFIPERWLDEESGSDMEIDGEKDKDKPKSTTRPAFMPFSMGPRACIGKSLALMELSMTVASLLARFDIRVAAGQEGMLGAGDVLAGLGRASPGEFQLYEWISCAKKGPLIQVRPVVR